MDGDTLNSISLKFDTTPAELARFNKKTVAGFSIFPGDVREGEGGGRRRKRGGGGRNIKAMSNYCRYL